MEKKDKPVDNMLSAVPGNWVFSKTVSNSFDSHVRKSVPCYEEVQWMIVKLSDFFVRERGCVYDIGMSTGETLKLLAKHHEAKKDVKFIGVDQSPSMVEVAREKCKNFDNISLFHRDAMQMERFDSADFIIALYTLQFLSFDQRYELISRIYNNLHCGGAFVYVDKIFGQNPECEYLYNEIHWDFKKEQGLNDEMILSKSRSLRSVLMPMTVSQNFKMLRKAGFTTFELFFKWMNFTGFLAIKTEPSLSNLKKDLHNQNTSINQSNFFNKENLNE